MATPENAQSLIAVPHIEWSQLSAEKLIVMAAEFGLRVLAAAAIIIIGRLVGKWVARIIQRLMRNRQVDETVVIFVGNVMNVLFMVVIVIAALGQVGVQTASLLTLLGAGGLAAGLALQGTLSSMSSGVMIIIFRPYRLKDTVELAGVMGTVREINLSNTVLLTGDNKTVIIPNNKIASEKIINYTMQGRRRVEVEFPISYDDDILLAKRVLAEVVEEDARFQHDPKPVIQVGSLTEVAVRIQVQAYAVNSDFGDAQAALLERGKIALEQAGITLATPQRTLLMGNNAEHFSKQKRPRKSDGQSMASAMKKPAGKRSVSKAKSTKAVVKKTQRRK